MILVTGATGLVGQEVLRELSAAGHPTIALVRNTAGRELAESMGARTVWGNVEDPTTWQQQLPDLTGVVHAAAIIAPRAEWQRFEAINVGGTASACNMALERGVPLVHISSVAVYGRRAADDASHSITEAYDHGRIQDHEYYARSKRLAEDTVFDFASRGLRACALRPCVIYGPGDRLLLPKLLGVARRGWFPMVGSGTRPIPLLHATSVAQAALAALATGRGWGKAFNVTGDAPVRTVDLRDAASTVSGRRLRVVRMPPGPTVALARAAEWWLRLLGPRRYPGTLQGAVRFLRGGDPYNSEAARTTLGWRPAIDHRKALVEAFRAVDRRG